MTRADLPTREGDPRTAPTQAANASDAARRENPAFDVLWKTLGVEATVASQPPFETIVPAKVVLHASASIGTETLPRLAIAGRCEGPPELGIGSTLGEGGMGVVQSATQVSLRREVAVKRLRGAGDAGEAAIALMREARVTGALEHPNVVPVYALGCDDGGTPMMVMKRVEGRSWGALLAARFGGPSRDDALKAEACAQDDEAAARAIASSLGKQLEIFVQVCNATHFAHSKGILHRDLKPDNVMLGGFGEVYLLDWGIALSTRAGNPYGLALASEVNSVAGTPAGAAPRRGGRDVLQPIGDASPRRVDAARAGAGHRAGGGRLDHGRHHHRCAAHPGGRRVVRLRGVGGGAAAVRLRAARALGRGGHRADHSDVVAPFHRGSPRVRRAAAFG